MAAPILDIPALAELVRDPNRPKAITAPWATVGALTNDIASGGITYMEMPLGALERGLDLVRHVREGLAEVTCPVLLIYGDDDQIVDKANGPYVLEHLGSSDKRLVALDDSAHVVTLDFGKERIMVEVYDFIRRLGGARRTSPRGCTYQSAGMQTCTAEEPSSLDAQRYLSQRDGLRRSR